MDWIILGVILLIVAAAALYIIRQKKKGKGCIGCPDSKTCNGCCSGCTKK